MSPKVLLKYIAILWVSMLASQAEENSTERLKQYHAPLKRSVNGRVYDLTPLVEWFAEDSALRNSPIRKQRPQNLVDWMSLGGNALAYTNGTVFIRYTHHPTGRAGRSEQWFVAIKNYPKPVKIGENVSALAMDLHYSRNDYLNQSPSSWRAFDFGTAAK